MTLQLILAYANSTWPNYAGDLENTHYQTVVGAMTSAPVVKWQRPTSGGVMSYGPSCFDVNGDPFPDVVFGSNDR